MKNKVYQLLTTKFEGVSSSILDKVADKLAKDANNEEDAKRLVDEYSFSKLLEYYGDSRATDATKTAVMNYEKKHGLKEGKLIEPKPIEHQGEDTPEWAKALIESNKALSEEVNKLKGEKQTEQRRSIVDKAISKLPESVRKAYQRIDLNSMSDEDFSALTKDLEKEVEDISKEMNGNSSVFSMPFGSNKGNNGAATEQEIDAVIQKMNL